MAFIVRCVAIVIAIFLLGCGTPQKGEPQFDKRSLFSAIELGDSSEVRRLLNLEEAKANILNEGGYTPLAAAVFAKDLEIVRILLEEQADPNFPQGARVRPLGIAIDREEPEAALMLLAAGAEAESAIIDGRTDPVITLVFSYIHDRSGLYKEVLRELLNKGLDPNVKMEDGTTALELAVRGDLSEVVSVLVCNGAKSVSKGPISIDVTKRVGLSGQEYHVRFRDRFGTKEEVTVNCGRAS